MVSIHPVCAECLLGRDEIELPVTEHLMALILQLVFHSGGIGPRMRLRPEIFGVRRIAPDLQRDERIFLIIPGVLIDIPIFLELSDFNRIGINGRWADGRSKSADAAG